MFCQNPGKHRYPVVSQINEQLERLLGEQGFGLVERSTHIAILPLAGTARLVPYYQYDGLEQALRKHKHPTAATVWKTVDKHIEKDPNRLADLLTADLWTWFDKEGGRAIASERHFGKKGVY